MESNTSENYEWKKKLRKKNGEEKQWKTKEKIKQNSNENESKSWKKKQTNKKKTLVPQEKGIEHINNNNNNNNSNNNNNNGPYSAVFKVMKKTPETT